jgi:hypothetical protein
MRLPSQLPPIVRTVSKVREANVERPAQSLLRLQGGQRPLCAHPSILFIRCT